MSPGQMNQPPVERQRTFLGLSEHSEVAEVPLAVLGGRFFARRNVNRWGTYGRLWARFLLSHLADDRLRFPESLHVSEDDTGRGEMQEKFSDVCK